MTFWPLPSVPPKCNLPTEILEACENFQKYYFSRHTGRRLTWQTNMVFFLDILLTFFQKKIIRGLLILEQDSIKGFMN